MSLRRATCMLGIACCLLGSVPALADDATATLGRLFMSPAQRAELDRLRKLGPATATATPETTVYAADESRPLAGSGYILRTEGEAYLWLDGDFREVRADRVTDAAVDDSLNITRHRQAAAESGLDTAQPEREDDESN